MSWAREHLAEKEWKCDQTVLDIPNHAKQTSWNQSLLYPFQSVICRELGTTYPCCKTVMLTPHTYGMPNVVTDTLVVHATRSLSIVSLVYNHKTYLCTYDRISPPVFDPHLLSSAMHNPDPLDLLPKQLVPHAFMRLHYESIIIFFLIRE